MARKRRKGRRPALPWVAAALAFALAVALLLLNVVFVVREVRVIGAGEVPEDDIRRLSGIRLGARIGALDAEAIRQSVESDGRVAFVSLETRLPATAVLTVRPRTPDAVTLQGGKILVLDSDAYVIQAGDRLPDARIPYVTGLKASYFAPGRQLDTADGRCAAMKAVLEALKANGAAAYVSELNVADPERMTVLSRTGITVLLGDARQMNEKIAWMGGALADLEARGESGGQLDVSSGTKADYRPSPKSEADAQALPEGGTGAAETEAAPG